jgi:superoxide dismutase
MWEHAFMVDYRPATKKDYVNTILSATNWNVVEERLAKASA